MGKLGTYFANKQAMKPSSWNRSQAVHSIRLRPEVWLVRKSKRTGVNSLA